MKADDDILLIYFGNEYCIIMMHLKILIEEWMDWGIVLATINMGAVVREYKQVGSLDPIKV